ncbi:helix-turn-helix transcriptional regulator [Pelomonas sp. SE-A7]|uniref:helix-turn-helix transcriptional regulator n=1 Tax=Pelomonas sp. SE-A7 TaxID=3054953 RepID=UPI00259CBCE9|nr:helix-turn-helix transcriptional regulator [Pelomonas sp. SE-A7]MDM4767892.1 helix-turn-helix transcriptional regulator [Pelomonas sp. SE-A7]
MSAAPKPPPATPVDNLLRRLRFEHGEMSQEALARAVGVTRQTIVALEGGRYAPSLELAMRLCHVFGRKVDEVFFWRDGAPPPL